METFLLGRHFKVYTDHRSLVHFKTQSNLNQRQLRWQEKAADYDMEILYKPGKENVVADALSRIRINLLCPLTNSFPPNTGYKRIPKLSTGKAHQGGGEVEKNRRNGTQ